MAQSLSGQTIESIGGKTVFGDVELLDFVSISLESLLPPTASAVAASVEQTLISKTSPPVLVRSVLANVSAAMPAAATLDGAALVRVAQGDASTSTSLVVDFQGQRTVTELTAPSGVLIDNVQAWLGTKFDPASVAGVAAPARSNTVAFQELQTEKLLVTVDSAVTPSAFAQGSVVIPTAPSNLELLVNGTRAWFDPGPATGDTIQVDVTAAVAAAAATPGQDIVLTFRAGAPAALTLAVTVDSLLRYTVVFPEGQARTVDAPTEGVYPLSLPVASAGFPWQVKGVALEVSAKIPNSRVQPADGPEFSTAAELVLDPDHGIVVQLPPAIIGSLGTVTGVRLPIVVGPDGAELAGTLRADAAGEPGDPVPKGGLGPVILQPPTAAASGDPVWIDLALTTAHAVAANELVWLDVQVARGSVVWSLAVPGSEDGDNATLRRRTSSGLYVPLSSLLDIPYAGALRVVGQEKPNDPLAAIEVTVAGAAANGSVVGVPTPAGAPMVLKLQPGVPFPAPPGGDTSEFPLELTISTPGSYAITSAELQYTTNGV